MSRTALALASAVVAWLGVAAVAWADGDEDGRCDVPVHLSVDAGRYAVSDAVLTGLSGASVLALSLIGPSSHHARGGVLVDEDVRGALRLPRETQRRGARDASDALLAIMLAYPFLVDDLAYTAWYRRSPAVALQLALVDLETLALVEAVRTVLNVTVSRERPYGRTCGSTLPNDARDCDSRSRYYSFFSGHAGQAFASAALSCSHHLNLGLFGGGAADATVCASGFGLAGATALLRVIADMHYLSDVLVGAAAGTAMGFLVPWLVLYRHRGGPADSAPTSGPVLTLVPTPGGAGVAGVF